MRECFILASSDDRAYMLERCIKCINENDLYKEAPVYLYWQGDESNIPYKDRFEQIIVSDRLRGTFLPRYELFKACQDYEYVILIDDDLYMYSWTTYENSIAFLEFVENNGVCTLARHKSKIWTDIRMIDYSEDKYNVFGGMVFPQKAVKLILDYFKDTDEDVTEDIFWVLLYVKGYDLYRDYTSRAIHTAGRRAKNGDISGYMKYRVEHPHKPLIPEYVRARQVKDQWLGGMRWKIPECNDVNEAGLAERERCRKEMNL